MVRLLIPLAPPRHRKALAHRHIRPRLGHQRIPDILLAPSCPALVVLLAERPNGHILSPTHEFACRRGGLGRNRVDIQLQLFAVRLERQVVDVVAEGVFDFASNGCESNDDVCGEDATRDRDPAEIVPELEGKHHDVDPGDLRDGDGVGDRQGGLEDAVHAG